MRFISRRKLVCTVSGMLSALLLLPAASAARPKYYVDKYADVEMPESLAVGTVRTPEFSVVPEWYSIVVQVEKPLPFLQMMCMMGATTGPLDVKDCNSNDPLLRADWKVWDGEHVVAQGSVPECGCKYENKYVYKLLGSFLGEAGKKYVVEVEFTKDGTPLNVANPHLIVIRHRHMW